MTTMMQDFLVTAVTEELNKLRGYAIVNGHLSSEEWDAVLELAVKNHRGGINYK